MYKCVHTHILIFTQAHEQIHTVIFMYTHIHMHIYAHTCTLLCIHTPEIGMSIHMNYVNILGHRYTNMHMFSRKCSCACTYRHTHIGICICAYPHACIYMQIYSYAQTLFLLYAPILIHVYTCSYVYT